MTIEIKVPNVGESINEVTVAKCLKQSGDYVDMDEILCELESDKATFELAAEKAGQLEIVAEEDSDLQIGDVVCRIVTSVAAPEKSEQADKPIESKPNEQVESTPVDSPEETYASGHPSPAAAKLMAENNLSASQVSGTGKDGRITKEDVLNAIKNQGEAIKPTAKPSIQEVGTFSREVRKEKMSKLRKTISKHLVAAKNQTAMLTTFNEVNMAPIMAIRKQYKEVFKETHGVGLGFMSFFTKACCLALMEFPKVNGKIENENFLLHDFCDVSIAVSTPKGLVVPVIRNAESLSLAEIELAVLNLAKKGRDNKLSLEEMEGGTFTLSNGGVFGSLLSTPILNAPQSAILGMHKIEERPIAENGEVVIKPMMYLALSYDHRIIDGKESVTFLVKVKEYLENPTFMLTGADPMKMMLGI